MSFDFLLTLICHFGCESIVESTTEFTVFTQHIRGKNVRENSIVALQTFPQIILSVKGHHNTSYNITFDTFEIISFDWTLEKLDTLFIIDN